MSDTRVVRRRTAGWKTAAALAALALAVPVPARASIPEPPDCPTPSLQPTLDSPRFGDLYILPGRTTCSGFEVKVVAHALKGLFTVSFELSYPADLMKLESHSLGPLLKKQSPRTTPFLFVREVAPGRIQAMMTRFAPDGAVAAVGSEVLLTLRFSRIAPGTGAIEFASDPAGGITGKVVNDQGKVVMARFGPGHGGTATLP